MIDRDTASRFGITPQMIDDTLYDAFGQRQVSIMFTQLNQYRVVLEAAPEHFSVTPSRSEDDLHQVHAGRPGPAQHVLRISTDHSVPLTVNHQGSSRWSRFRSIFAANASLGAAVDEVNKAAAKI